MFWQVYEVWSDWALPLRVSFETENKALVLQVGPFYLALVFWKPREV